MNKQDRGNLAFVLARAHEGEDVLTEFLDTLDDDDLSYTLDLLNRFKSSQKKVVDKLFD